MLNKLHPQSVTILVSLPKEWGLLSTEGGMLGS